VKHRMLQRTRMSGAVVADEPATCGSHRVIHVSRRFVSPVVRLQHAGGARSIGSGPASGQAAPFRAAAERMSSVLPVITCRQWG
jgi:hypothetical protein